MSPPLPTEIIAEIIHLATFRPASPALTNHHPYHTHLLANLCIVSRTFYTLAASLLYREIIVHKDITTSLLTPKLLPLLSKPQRLQLLSETNTEEPINHALYYKDRIANPCWVHRLTVLSVRPSRSGEEHIPWRYLEEAVSGMQNLRSITIEAAEGTPKLIATISELPKLNHISCVPSSLLCAPTQSPHFDSIRLKSLAANLSSSHKENIGGLRNLVYPSRESLETLHLYYPDLLPSIASVHITGMLQGIDSLPNLRNLRLCVNDLSTIEALGKVIDFNTLTSLQIVRGAAVVAARNDASAVLGKLSALTKLSVVLTHNEVIDVLDICKGLQEIHIACNNHCKNSSTLAYSAERLVNAVVRHGGTLKALTLYAGLSGNRRVEGRVLGAKEVERLVKGCPGVEELRINIDATEFTTICTILPHLHLRHLALDLTIYDDSPLTLPITSTITPLSMPWYDPTSSSEDTPPSQVSRIENTLSHLISAFTHYPTSWRQHVPKLIYISLPGANPVKPSYVYSQAYTIHEPSEPLEDGDGATRWYHSVPYFAPPGQLFQWKSDDAKVHVRVVDEVPRGHDGWNGKLAGWDMAFKPVSGATVPWENVIY